MDALVGRRALAGEAVEPLMLQGHRARRAGEERWLITRAKPILGADGRALYSVTAIEDVTEVKRGESAQRLLARIGGFLSSSTDYRGMLRGLASLTVPAFADWCTVDMLGRRRGRRTARRRARGRRAGSATWSACASVSRSASATTAGVAEVLEGARPQLIETPDDLVGRLAVDAEHESLLRSVGMRSGLMAPMSVGGRTLGVLTFGSGSRRFDEHDLDLAAEIARRAATAVENARLAEERSEVARVLQEGLMPRALPYMRGWETAAVYQPAGEVNAVGGDFYDAFEIDGGWMVTIGDVVGRGAAAASLTALARHTIRTAGSLTGDPCKALSMLDEALRARGETSICTAAILILPESRRRDGAGADGLGRSSAAAAAARRRGRRSWAGPGPLLGAFATSSWEPVSHEIAAGDQLVVFTDGVIEAQGAADRFGEDRLRKPPGRRREPAGRDRPGDQRARGLRRLRARRRRRPGGRCGGRESAAEPGGQSWVSPAQDPTAV